MHPHDTPTSQDCAALAAWCWPGLTRQEEGGGVSVRVQAPVGWLSFRPADCFLDLLRLFPVLRHRQCTQEVGGELRVQLAKRGSGRARPTPARVFREWARNDPRLCWLGDAPGEEPGKEGKSSCLELVDMDFSADADPPPPALQSVLARARLRIGVPDLELVDAGLVQACLPLLTTWSIRLLNDINHYSGALREIMFLACLGRMSPKEIADAISLPQHIVDFLLHHGLLATHRFLRKEYGIHWSGDGLDFLLPRGLSLRPARDAEGRAPLRACHRNLRWEPIRAHYQTIWPHLEEWLRPMEQNLLFQPHGEKLLRTAPPPVQRLLLRRILRELMPEHWEECQDKPPGGPSLEHQMHQVITATLRLVHAEMAEG